MTRYDLRDMAATTASPRLGTRSPTGCDTFDYAAGQPNIFMLMNFKQLLVEEHGLERAFELYRRTVSRHCDTTLDLRPLESHYAFSRARGDPFIEVSPAGEPFTIMPPAVIGAGDHRPLINTTRSFYVACLTDARVRGRSSVTEVAGTALADYQGVELERIDDELEFDSSVFHRDGKRIWMISEERDVRQINTAFSLLGCRTDFFGDWLSESIPKYVAATLSGRLPPAPVLIDADMPRTHRQALEAMLLPGAEIIEVPAFDTVEVARLWSASSLGYMPFHQKFNERFKWDYLMNSPQRFFPVRREMLRRADLVLGAERGPSRVFLARKSFRHRKLVNHVEIEAIAAACGFAIVYTEDFDFIEQVRLLRHARFVVGPEGSSFFLNVFMGCDVRMCILNHTFTEGLVSYNSGAELINMELTIITGPRVGPQRGSPQDVDYTIDPEVFRRFLDDWLAADAS